MDISDVQVYGPDMLCVAVRCAGSERAVRATQISLSCTGDVIDTLESWGKTMIE